MTKKVLASILLLGVTFMIQPFAQGQTNSPESSVQDWQGLRNLKSGRLRVETKQGKVIDADFVGITGARLTLSYGFNFLSVEQPDLQRVYLQKTGSSRQKKAIVGAVIGGIVGLLIGGKIGAGIDAREAGPPFQDALTPGGATTAYSTLGGAAAGYGIGYLVGGKRKGKLLYESK